MKYYFYFKLFSYIPLLNLLSLFLLVLHAYFLNGYMPVYNMPDPKTLSFTYILFQISDFFLIFSFFVFPILILVVTYKKSIKKSLIFKYIIIYILSLAVILIVYRIEVLKLANWITD